MKLPVSLVRGVAFAAAYVFSAAVTAQDPTEVAGMAAPGGVIVGQRIDPGFRPDVVAPPQALAQRLSKHTIPKIPEGPYRPLPPSAPSLLGQADRQPVEAGQFRYFQNSIVEPSGASTSTIGEPSAAIVRDTAFMTGNWYAARSIDSGETWTHINPYTRFGAIDGGYCCDQRVYYSQVHDLTVWLLQYSYSATTQRGSHLLAVANGKADLQNDTWFVYRFDPGRFGFGAGNWLDFPDIASTDAKLYLSANVYRGSDDSYQGSVVWFVDLAEMAAHQPLGYRFATSSTLGGSTYRFAEGGERDHIYFASQRTTSSHYVYRMGDIGGWSRVTRDVGSFSNAQASCPGPDGRDWCGNATGRFRGTFGTATEVGWMLTSAAMPGDGRPMPFTRVVRFTANNARTLIAEHDIWNPSLAFAFATGRSNSRGDIGLVMAVGGATSYVHSSAAVIDSYDPWPPATVWSMGGGTHGPSVNRWGDYFDVQRHPTFPNTFVGTGMSQNGGPSNADNEPRFAWFGRDDYEPVWVNLSVSSTGVSPVRIGMNVTDLGGDKDGDTTFLRRFAPGQAYTLVAPSLVTSGSAVYAFEKWTLRPIPGGPLISGPIGETTFPQSTIGNQDDFATARYVARRELTVRSVHPSSGVTISVSPADLSGDGDGTTGFTRFYRQGDAVTLQAPPAVRFNDFRYWRVNGVTQLGGATVSVTMDGTKIAEAVYYDNVAGRADRIGEGCEGGDRRTPNHYVTWPGGQQGPQQGTPTSYVLTNAVGNAGLSLHVGVSEKLWGAFRLPLDLGIFGVDGCTMYHDLIFAVAGTTSGSGTDVIPITWPVSRALLGASVYTSYAILDLGAPRPLPLTLSNAMQTVIGGNRR